MYLKLFWKRLAAMLLAMLMLTGSAFAEDDDEEIDITEVSGLDLVMEEVEPEEGEAIEDFYLDDEQKEQAEEMDLELDTSVNPDDLELNPNLPDNVINILLIGIDTHDTSVDGGMQHNDTNIVLSVNRETGEIKMTSFLRDTYVTIPGYQKMTRINNAYARGGGQLAMRTINHNFDMNCQYYVTINFYGLAEIIDSIGGIDVDLISGEAAAINNYLKKNARKMTYDEKGNANREPLLVETGVQHLDGIQAVMYARLRSKMVTAKTGDFARTERQRHLLELLLKEVASDITVDKLLTLVEACLPYVKTNLSASVMVELALTVLQSGIADKARAGEELFQQFRVPMDHTYKYKDVDGMSVIYLSPNNNLPKNVQAFHEFVYGQYYPAK